MSWDAKTARLHYGSWNIKVDVEAYNLGGEVKKSTQNWVALNTIIVAM